MVHPKIDKFILMTSSLKKSDTSDFVHNLG